MYIESYETLGQVTSPSGTQRPSPGPLLDVLFQKIQDAVRRGQEIVGVRIALERGIRDENRLTNLIFFARHPERGGQALRREEPQFEQLSREWVSVRDDVVRPALTRLQVTTRPGARTQPSPTPASPVIAPTQLDAKSCPRGGGKTTERCTGGMAVDCPTIRDLLCVTRVMGVPFEYVANGRTKSGKRIKRIIKSSTRGLFEVVDRVPNWPQRFIPEVGTALSAFLTNMTKFGMPVAGILTMGSYFCRCIKHTKKLSNHSFGDAIDIVGVRWPAATGSSSWLSDTIIHNFNTGDEREMRLVRRINACLRLSFATVLDYNYKPRPHLDHFHCDLRNSRRRDRRPRRPDTLYFVQEALTLMRGRPVPTTGKWDPLTERGLMEFSGASQESLRKEDSLLNRILDDLFTRVAAQT